MSTGRVRRALFLPAFDQLASARVMGDLGQAAEQAGWDGLFVWDHLLYNEPVQAIADPWIAIAAIATRTETLLTGPLVTPLPRRRPQVLARQAATLDELSGGRLVLGFGIGDDGGVGELSRFGEELDAVARGSMLTEGLEVLTGLLSGEPVAHHGEHYAVDVPGFLPAAPRIPIWLASRWPRRRPVRRAARYDGLFTIGLTEPDDVRTLAGWIAEDRIGDGPFELVVQGTPGDDPAPWAAAGATWFLTQLGPYRLRLDVVRAVVDAGPEGTR